LHRVAAWRLGCQSNLDTREEFRQHHRRINLTVDLQVDIACPHAVAVSILNDTDGDATRTCHEPQCDGRRPADGLGSREGHARREIPGSGEAA
jgi:hypothetical protein